MAITIRFHIIGCVIKASVFSEAKTLKYPTVLEFLFRNPLSETITHSVCACMSVDCIWTGAAQGTSALSGNSEAEGVTGEFVICGVITES